MVDEFAKAVGLPEKVDRELPAPGSNRGIDPSVYVRTLMYHFSEGGRHIEDIREVKSDEEFRSLIDLGQMPGPDAIGDWLRRMGTGNQQEGVWSVNDMLVRHYLENKLEREAEEQHAEEQEDGEELKGLTLDVDATIIEADKGDGRTAYDGTVGYHPGNLGFPCLDFCRMVGSGHAARL